MRPYGIMRRNVDLEKGWYRDAIGAMPGVKKIGRLRRGADPPGLFRTAQAASMARIMSLPAAYRPFFRQGLI